MKKKKVIIVMLFSGLLIVLFKYPIVFFAEDFYDLSKVSGAKNYKQTFNPLESIDANDCQIFIYISNDDIREIPKEIYSHKMLYTSDSKVINELKRKFWFKRTGGDMTTCESRMIIYSMGKIVFSSSIVITNDLLGLQGDFGWAETSSKKDIIALLSKFKPKYQPMFYFN